MLKEHKFAVKIIKKTNQNTKPKQKSQLQSRTINKLRAEAFLTGLVESFPDVLLALS